MATESQSHQSDGANSDSEVVELRRQIHERSQALAVLHGKLADVQVSAVPTGEKDPAERERLRLQKTDPQSEAIRVEIRQLTADLMKLGERLEAHQGGSGRSLTPQEEEEISLRRRLLALADEQNDAVRRWNREPSPKRRPAFEEELWKLHREYGQVLDRLKTLRGRRGSEGAGSRSTA